MENNANKSQEKCLVIRYTDLQKMTGLSNSTIRRLITQDEFAKPFRIGARAVGFDREEVLEWIERRKQRSPKAC